jgi:hypothetical protein
MMDLKGTDDVVLVYETAVGDTTRFCYWVLIVKSSLNTLFRVLGFGKLYHV